MFTLVLTSFPCPCFIQTKSNRAEVVDQTVEDNEQVIDLEVPLATDLMISAKFMVVAEKNFPLIVFEIIWLWEFIELETMAKGIFSLTSHNWLTFDYDEDFKLKISTFSFI